MKLQLTKLLLLICLPWTWLCAEITMGMTREAVVAQYGNPVANMEMEDTERAIFQNSVKVLFRDNLVVGISGVETLLHLRNDKGISVEKPVDLSEPPPPPEVSAQPAPTLAVEKSQQSEESSDSNTAIVTDFSIWDNKVLLVIGGIVVIIAVGILLSKL